jgi:hypothetical protein
MWCKTGSIATPLDERRGPHMTRHVEFTPISKCGVDEVCISVYLEAKVSLFLIFRDRDARKSCTGAAKKLMIPFWRDSNLVQFDLDNGHEASMALAIMKTLNAVDGVEELENLVLAELTAFLPHQVPWIRPVPPDRGCAL